MKQQFLQQPAVKRTLLAVALAVAYGNAPALTLSEFTWNPAGAGMAGASFTATQQLLRLMPARCTAFDRPRGPRVQGERR